MNLIYYKSENCIYVALSGLHHDNTRQAISNPNRYIINGEKLLSTFHNAWFKVENVSEIASVKELIAGRSLIDYYQIIDESLVSPAIPATISSSDGHFNYDDEERYWVSEKYPHIGNLYRPVYKKEDDYYKDVEFSCQCLGEVSAIGDTGDMKVALLSSNGFSIERTHTVNLSAIARYDELVKMLVPDLLLHRQPCSLTSIQSYNIVRQYVRDNIDPKTAYIDSDYDFCFSVLKKIMVNPYIQETERKKANGKSYRNKVIIKKVIDSKGVELFRMTHDVKKYKGYPIIQGFSGDSLADLAENIRMYLENLMYYINVPAKECEHCKGSGHFIDTGFQLNGIKLDK